MLAVFALEVKEESIRSAWFFDDDRTRLPKVDAGGGGGRNAGAEVALGESLECVCEGGTGDRPR